MWKRRCTRVAVYQSTDGEGVLLTSSDVFEETESLSNFQRSLPCGLEITATVEAKVQ